MAPHRPCTGGPGSSPRDLPEGCLSVLTKTAGAPSKVSDPRWKPRRRSNGSVQRTSKAHPSLLLYSGGRADPSSFMEGDYTGQEGRVVGITGHPLIGWLPIFSSLSQKMFPWAPAQMSAWFRHNLAEASETECPMPRGGIWCRHPWPRSPSSLSSTSPQSWVRQAHPWKGGG